MAMAGKIKELINKYGRVGLVVHVAVSTASFSACYVAIKNNVDVNHLLQRAGFLPNPPQPPVSELPEETVVEKIGKVRQEVIEKVDHAAESALNQGGALALAFVANKALFPVRIPLTVALTPPIHRVWARTRFFRKT